MAAVPRNGFSFPEGAAWSSPGLASNLFDAANTCALEFRLDEATVWSSAIEVKE